MLGFNINIYTFSTILLSFSLSLPMICLEMLAFKFPLGLLLWSFVGWAPQSRSSAHSQGPLDNDRREERKPCTVQPGDEGESTAAVETALGAKCDKRRSSDKEATTITIQQNIDPHYMFHAARFVTVFFQCFSFLRNLILLKKNVKLYNSMLRQRGWCNSLSRCHMPIESFKSFLLK